jgi:hypothetical protein
VFSRKQSDVATPQPAPQDAPAPDPVGGGKGRPTPKRSAAQAANRRPLVPADRKAAAKTARAASRAERDRQFKALQSGDERYLPAKDRGPVRRYIRDHVDARFNLGEVFLPIAMVFVLLTLLVARSVAASAIVMFALYGFVLVACLDAYLMWRGLRKKLAGKFGDEAQQKGLAMYAVLRVFQLRRSRLPRPQVKRGEYPV